jgi:hypothetical protein
MSGPEDGIGKTYAGVICKGLQQLLGRSNVSVMVEKDAVWMKVEGLRLTSVRWINMDSDVVITFDVSKLSIVSKFRDCPEVW